MNERRIHRIQELIKHRVAEVIDHELSDPRRGLITITRVKVDRELMSCEVFWSLLGDEKARRLNTKMLEDARAFVQREVAGVLHTRTVPHLKFRYDESIEGAVRMENLFAELRRQRGEDPDSTEGDETLAGDEPIGDGELPAPDGAGTDEPGEAPERPA
jgi:ribosome-binding factor A